MPKAYSTDDLVERRALGSLARCHFRGLSHPDRAIDVQTDEAGMLAEGHCRPVPPLQHLQPGLSLLVRLVNSGHDARRGRTAADDRGGPTVGVRIPLQAPLNRERIGAIAEELEPLTA
jgi:hypothetical protein